MTPKRVHIADMCNGARCVVLSCSCVQVGRVAATWEPGGKKHAGSGGGRGTMSEPREAAVPGLPPLD